METLSMSVKERRQLEVLSRVKSRELSLVKAAEVLAISYRQAKRLWARFQEEGDAGLLHRLRGRVSNRHVQPLRKEQALELYREKYTGYGPTLASEWLDREDGLAVPVSTLRVWLCAAGLWQRQRRRKLHRRRRPRRDHLGELVQMDGSHHDWFEGRRGTAVLMVMIDDATSRTYARFFENESWHSAATTLRRYTARHGLPRALYVDQHSIYRADWEPTPDEIFTGIEPKTQFGRALHELDVELILAHSPQAKGRVERVNRTLQDRLVKELTRAGISGLEVANRFLEETYLSRFNQQFGKPATKSANLHRLVTDERVLRVLSLQQDRVLQPDWTVRWHNGFLQLPRATAEYVQPGQRVVMSEQLDGQLCVFVGNQQLTWSNVRETPQAPAVPRSPTRSNQGQKPAANHPWRHTPINGHPTPPGRRPPCSPPVATSSEASGPPAQPTRSKAGGKKKPVLTD
jgi:transposase